MRIKGEEEKEERKGGGGWKGRRKKGRGEKGWGKEEGRQGVETKGEGIRNRKRKEESAR